MELIEAGIPQSDGCPILTRLPAFIATQGVPVTLQNIVRDRTGQPKDLSAYFVATESESDSDSDGDIDNQGSVVLRVKEWLAAGTSSSRNPIWELPGEAVTPASGIVKCDLIESVVRQSGIYELNWGIKNASGAVVYAHRGILSVERSLFTDDPSVLSRNNGPPTLNEIRMWMMDSSPKENLLLQDMEFSDEQILLALTWPVQQWNEALPPIKPHTTRTFPYRGAWASGTLAQLYKMAASNYRRNRLDTRGGGLSVDDKNKEREYMAEGVRLSDDYEDWVRQRKYSINVQMVAGNIHSQYSHRIGW